MKRILCGLLLGLFLSAAALAEVPVFSMEKRALPDNEAIAFAQKLGVGWNLGNTFDAIRDQGGDDEMTIESWWVGVLTTREMIHAVKEAGFSTLRVPVSWHNHLTDENFTISEPWLARVSEVVRWGLDEGLYVIVNIHHDDYREYLYPSGACAENSERYVRAIWSQLAACFADCGDALIFECCNEPRLVGTDNEWWFNGGSRACRDAASALNRINQAFVDTVRAAGGNNAARFLMIPGYDASADGALTTFFKLPEDSAEHRLMVSVHAYTPYAFALEAGGTSSFAVGRQSREIDSFMDRLYDRFVKNGIPVVIGEFGARDKNNLSDRVTFTAYYVSAAKAHGMPCCWWDNNVFAGNGECFGLLRRTRVTWAYPSLLRALVGGE